MTRWACFCFSFVKQRARFLKRVSEREPRAESREPRAEHSSRVHRLFFAGRIERAVIFWTRIIIVLPGFFLFDF